MNLQTSTYVFEELQKPFVAIAEAFDWMDGYCNDDATVKTVASVKKERQKVEKHCKKILAEADSYVKLAEKEYKKVKASK
jgi:hypothetical protein